jgi:hypothetical protein
MTDANTDAKARAVLAARIARYRTTRGPAHKGLLGRLGPGLIIGASDDDPCGIATYSTTYFSFTSAIGFPRSAGVPASTVAPKSANHANQPANQRGDAVVVPAEWKRDAL